MSEEALQLELGAGTIIDDRYRLEKMLGQGGHGSVWLAQDVHLKRSVAIKLVHPSSDDAGVTAARLQREAKVLQRLEHPNIVQVFRIGMLKCETFFLAIEYVPGRDLAALLNHTPLPLKDAISIANQIVSAMCEAEKHGIVHRDLKPQNVLVMEIYNQEGERKLKVKVADFGLSTTSTTATLQFGTLTRAGVALGTPLYMSPEQCQGKETDRRSDIYSFGCVLFEMLTGETPYTGDSAAAILMKHVRDPVPSLPGATSRDETAVQLQALLTRCLAKEPLERYQTFIEVQDALRPLSGTDSTTTYATGSNTTVATRSRRRIWRRTALASALLLAITGGALLLLPDEQKAAVLAQTAIVISPGHPESALSDTVLQTKSAAGTAAARRLAEATLFTAPVRDLSREAHYRLLRSYITIFSRPGSMDDCSVFADQLLGQCLLDANLEVNAAQLGQTALTPDQLQALNKNLEFVVDGDWSADTWRLFSQTLSGYRGTMQPTPISHLRDSYLCALLHQLLGEALLHNNQAGDPQQNILAANHFFDAAGRAAIAGSFDRARHLTKQMEALHHDWVLDSWLTLVSCELTGKRYAAARRDFQEVLRVRQTVPFARPSTERMFHAALAQLEAAPLEQTLH